MATPLLSFREKAKAGEVHVDLPTLLTTRGLIQGSPGSGKSVLARGMHEQTHGRVPHWIVDPEGEFYTLREKYPYILVGRAGGDLQPIPQHASMLVRRLAELEADVIFDLSDMSLKQQREYIGLLAQAMIDDLPHELWHHRLLHISEVSVFAPEEGKVASTEAVLELARRGRKRGWGLVCDTQRISSLDKDVAAICQNVFIGFTGLDVDVDRASRRLGFRTKEQRQELTQLDVGTFLCVGPAVSKTVITARSVYPTQTTHPSPGQMRPPVPPTPDKVHALVKDLGDVPKQAEEEARTLEEMRARLGKVEAENKQLRRDVAAKPHIDEGVVEQARRDAAQMEWERHDRVRQVIARHLDGAGKAASALAETAGFLFNACKELTDRLAIFATKVESHVGDLAAIDEVLAKEYPIESPQRNVVQRAATSSSLGKDYHGDRQVKQRVILEVARTGRLPGEDAPNLDGLSGSAAKLLAGVRRAEHLFRGPVPRLVAAAFASYREGGRLRAIYGELGQRGLVESAGHGVVHLTDAGREATRDVPLPRSERELHNDVIAMFKPQGQVIMGEAIRRWPHAVPRREIAELLGMQEGGRFRAVVGEVTRTGLLKALRGEVRASDHLFPERRR